MGNPPWIAFRFLEPDYQKFIRQQIKDYYLLSGKGHLITHLEVAGLFLVRAADLYLKEGGAIAFVMPRAVFTADQQDELRRGTFRFTQDKLFHLVWTALWDCDRVKPLFNVPACVVWGKKIKALHAPKTIPGEIISGTLPGKNASLTEANQNLTVTPTTFSVHRHGKRSHLGRGNWHGFQGSHLLQNKIQEWCHYLSEKFLVCGNKTFSLGVQSRPAAPGHRPPGPG